MHSALSGWIRVGLTAAAVLALAAAPAASQTRGATPEALALRADVVAVGRVSTLSSHWDEKHSRIYTTVTLAVDDYLKGGGAGMPLTLVVPGGEVDGVGEIYSHTATFRPEESVLVFAVKDAQGTYRVTGGAEGKYSVRKDETTGRMIVGGTRTLEDVKAGVARAILDREQK